MKQLIRNLSGSDRNRSTTVDAGRTQSRRSVRLLAAAGLFLCLFAAACNTVEGAGKDVERLGEKTSEAARDAHDN